MDTYQGDYYADIYPPFKLISSEENVMVISIFDDSGDLNNEHFNLLKENGALFLIGYERIDDSSSGGYYYEISSYDFGNNYLKSEYKNLRRSIPKLVSRYQQIDELKKFYSVWESALSTEASGLLLIFFKNINNYPDSTIRKVSNCLESYDSFESSITEKLFNEINELIILTLKS
ncbi:hypothetical protein [Vagococcus fluvialis]|uniref:hypothetical protein n=1 Tax=Vagococcus fluvialis TaxID=2738 RepID=UPI001D0BD71F|nr:hypothetical protein [Vagococcus fluvialis]UDM80393.1 hypothetical protein K5K97_03445 [Vagococcus fluvialis]